MDAVFPYADDAARLNLLYRLPGTPAPRRLLVVGACAGLALTQANWGGPVRTVAVSDLAGETLPGSSVFDGVALPGTLGDPDRAAALLDAAHRLLAPGGVVVGHVAHRWALRPRAAQPGLRGRLRTLAGVGSAGACRRALQHAGFIDVACYFVQPDIDAPMGLVPCEPAASRAYFLRSVRATVGQQGPLSYAARWMLAFAGLGGLQQSELFFWAHKPC